jgi:hypothetical protein
MKKYILFLSLVVCFLVHPGATGAHEVVDSSASAGVAMPNGYLTIDNDTQSTFNLYINGGLVKVIAANEHSTLSISTSYTLGSIGVSAIDYTTHTIDVVGNNSTHYSTTNIYAYYSDVYLTPYSSLHIH